jgi:divalent metal cation (Fe/Co/Zn/Cd) transporter
MAERTLVRNEEAHLAGLRADAVRLALFLTYITIGWMTIEGAAALLLGWASKSLLLEAFGIDSIIELFSAGVLLWRLRVEASGTATSEHVDLIERRAARLVGYSLYALIAYVILNSGYGLFIAKRITDTHGSVWGILIGLVAKIGMPILAGYKLKVAARLNSRALRADAIESITCGYLSLVLIIGLGATRLLGWWWLDSVAALALIPFLIKEARAAIAGDECCSRVEQRPELVAEEMVPCFTEAIRRVSRKQPRVQGKHPRTMLGLGL